MTRKPRKPRNPRSPRESPGVPGNSQESNALRANGRRARAELARRSLTQASSGADPDVSRLVSEVPALMAEARRRGRSDPAGRSEGVAAQAWRLLPGLSAVTAGAVVFAGIVLFTRGGPPAEAGPTVDAVLLGAQEPGAGSTGDLLLDAVLDMERHDG